jgi:hypothetical protein
VDGPAIVSTHNDKIKYNYNNNDIIAVADSNQGGAPQLQPIIRLITPTKMLPPTTMPMKAMMTMTAAMMMTILLDMTMRALSSPLSTPTKAIKTTTKTTTKAKTKIYWSAQIQVQEQRENR